MERKQALTPWCILLTAGSVSFAVCLHLPVGLIRVNRISSNTAVIHDFCVLPTLQGQGLGRSILAAAVELLLAEPDLHIRLGVVTDNKQALKLYRSAGFAVTGEFLYYTGPVSALT
ncbi:hypothetical protein C2I18_02055 [Paenibacillus sp. PK3_47]|uniref:GNAT family N-acetyltransferase n=1 Tax=Paenibacillus sp. PK3_47 TaxID=2072642 RepID=UPI00201DEF76|nr:GNAT family N-acetyltransferase [Paenibacillus sp. PK3_47]UQZ32441.1 hypothetical protein C2I18_02055 [Paenibacillus sp. PK3_47]